MSGAVAYLYTLFAVVSDRLDERKDRGATAVEYGLLVGLIAVMIIAGAGLIGTNLDAMFTRIAGLLD